jgi:hypothetical protein
MQETDCSVKFWSVVWSGKTQVVPNAISDKIQAFLIPQNKVQLQAFLGLLENWSAFITHGALTLAPLYALM